MRMRCEKDGSCHCISQEKDVFCVFALFLFSSHYHPCTKVLRWSWWPWSAIISTSSFPGHGPRLLDYSYVNASMLVCFGLSAYSARCEIWRRSSRWRDGRWPSWTWKATWQASLIHHRRTSTMSGNVWWLSLLEIQYVCSTTQNVRLALNAFTA
jgi:hypothetical protein